MLDYESLMEPFGDDAPCGPDLRDEPEFREIEDAPGDFANQKLPELRQQIARCDAFLARTKDQAPALVALQAAVRIGDFALAADALRLVKGYAELYWDDFHPGPAEEMAIGRINELSALARPAAMVLPIQRAAMAAMPAPSMTTFTAAMIAQACSPTPQWTSDDESVLAAQVENGQISATVARAVRPNRDGARQLRTIMRSLSSAARADDVAAKIDADDTGMDEAVLQRLALDLRDQVERARDGLALLSDLLYEINEIYDARAGDSASLGPVLSLLKTVVGDADRFLTLFPAAEEAAADSDLEHAGAGEEAVAPTGGAPAAALRGYVASVPQTRADVLAAMDSISRFYVEREPGSPVPLMLDRIRSWVQMDFLELMAEIAPTGMLEARELLASRSE